MTKSPGWQSNLTLKYDKYNPSPENFLKTIEALHFQSFWSLCNLCGLVRFTTPYLRSLPNVNLCCFFKCTFFAVLANSGSSNLITAATRSVRFLFLFMKFWPSFV